MQKHGNEAGCAHCAITNAAVPGTNLLSAAERQNSLIHPKQHTAVPGNTV